MTSAAHGTLQAACEQLRGAADGALTWEWDGRFGAALAAFDKPVEPQVLAALDEVFDKIWSAAELQSGPRQVSDLATRLGGLRSGQMLLTAFTDQAGPMLYCAWWPWGSGARISIRIGAVPVHDPADTAQLATNLQSWFQIA